MKQITSSNFPSSLVQIYKKKKIKLYRINLLLLLFLSELKKNEVGYQRRGKFEPQISFTYHHKVDESCELGSCPTSPVHIN